MVVRIDENSFCKLGTINQTLNKMNDQIKKVALQVATFAAIFGLMSFFMQMMEEPEEQTTYSITLENLAHGNGETDGENGGGGNTSGESCDPQWGGFSNFFQGQGFWKDEEEVKEECPPSQQNSSGISISGSSGNSSGSVSTNTSNSQTNNGRRTDIRCKLGCNNCTPIDC